MYYNQPVRRGEMHWVESAQNQVGAEIKKTRPAIVVSSNENNERSEMIEIVYMTTQPKRDHPTHVTIASTSNGKGEGSVALCECIYSISKRRLQEDSYYGRVSDEDMAEIDRALMASLGLDKYIAEDDDFEEDWDEETCEAGTEENDELYDNALRQARVEAEFYKQKYEELLDRIMTKAKL